MRGRGTGKVSFLTSKVHGWEHVVLVEPGYRWTVRNRRGDQDSMKFVL